MKTETSVDKINRIHKGLEKKKSFRVVRLIHSVLAYMCFFVVLLTGALFVYEKMVTEVDTGHLEAVVSTKAEYEDGETIEFYVIADIDHTEVVELTTILRCDSHDTRGTYYVGEYTHTLTATEHSSSVDILTNTKLFLGAVGESASFKVKASGIRNVVNSAQPPLQYRGPLPTALVSTCYTDNTFRTASPIFGIPVNQTVQSYPFEYVWYNYFNGNKQ